MEPSRILIPSSKKKLRCEMDVLKFSGFLFFCFLVSVCMSMSLENFYFGKAISFLRKMIIYFNGYWEKHNCIFIFIDMKKTPQNLWKSKFSNSFQGLIPNPVGIIIHSDS